MDVSNRAQSIITDYQKYSNKLDFETSYTVIVSQAVYYLKGHYHETLCEIIAIDDNLD
jgi:hypothetical protein